MDPEFSLRFALGCLIFWAIIGLLIACAVELGLTLYRRERVSVIPRSEPALLAGSVVFILGTLACVV